MPRCLNPRCQMDYPAGSLQCTNPFCQCILPESVIAGRYRIETLIGIGGMGTVYRVSDTFEMQQVALKVLSLGNSSIDIATAVERFRREARYAHQLRHKNIVPVLNFGQDGHLLYLIMPLITGGSLKTLLKAEAPLPTPQAQAYLNDLATAVDVFHMHPQQIVHRDIKPSNLLIHQDDGRLVVTDFGIARAMQHEKPLTQRGWALGTEHYIAPEQEMGQAQPASDIYAMGVVAYQMFTGLLPFQAVIRNQDATLPPPSQLNSALPPAVDAVIERAMDIDPNKRFSSGKAFADALADALSGEDIWSAPTITSTLTTTNTANVIVRTIIPENPCSQCGGENRPTSRFCRHCGHNLDETSPMINDTCQVGYLSDEGEQAEDNEDVLLVVQGLCVTMLPPRPFSLFAVADGLRGPQGKAAGGLEASRLAIETLADILLPHIITLPRSLTKTKSETPPSQPIPIKPSSK
ncbi:MAG: protein kinase, partial [Ktedonobacteraceae bacterium]|nr:protein kinase [Ktedonobacteraceae bacterium]